MKTTRDNTNKKKIINNIFNQIGIPSNYAAKLVDDLISILISNIITKKKLKIKNFGSFSLNKKYKRTGRNPQNKTIYEILERNVVTFKSSKDLKKRLI